MTDIERLKFLRKSLKIQQGEFAESLGLKQGSYSDIERGRSNINYTLLQKLCEIYNTNPTWLMYGKGDIFMSKSMSNSMSNSMPKSEIATLSGVQPVIVTVDEAGNDNIVFVDAKAAAGYVSHRLEPTFIKDLPAFKLPGGELRNASYRAFEIEGDSMHDTINAGDWVVARLMEGGPNEIRNGYVHVIVTQNDILVKRCLNRVKDSSKIVCKSDNDAYPDFDLNAKDISEVWQVRKLITGHLPARNRELKLIVGRLEEEMVALKTRQDNLEAFVRSKP